MKTPIEGVVDIRIVVVLGAVLLVGTAWYIGPLSGSNVGNHMGMMESMSNMHRSMHAMMHGEAPGETGGATVNALPDELTLESKTEQWLGRTAGFETIDDRTGASEIVVEVGAGNGLTYAPAAVRVDPGTTVRWEWTGSGGLHDVAFVNAEINTSLHGEQGAEYAYTFAKPGEYRYECTPHAPVGMRGVVIVEKS